MSPSQLNKQVPMIIFLCGTVWTLIIQFQVEEVVRQLNRRSELLHVVSIITVAWVDSKWNRNVSIIAEFSCNILNNFHRCEKLPSSKFTVKENFNTDFLWYNFSWCKEYLRLLLHWKTLSEMAFLCLVSWLALREGSTSRDGLSRTTGISILIYLFATAFVSLLLVNLT